MGVGLTITYDDAPLRAATARLQQFPRDRAHAMWDAIGAAMVAKTQLRFRQGMGPDGVPWKPSRRVLSKGGQTLVLSRRLLDSITHNVASANDGVEWGSNVRYAAIHQQGGTIKRVAREQATYRTVNKKGELSARFTKRRTSNFAQSFHVGAHEIDIPARPYLGIDNDDRAEIADISRAHLSAALLGTSVASVRGSQ